DLLTAMRSRHPLALEETFEQVVLEAFETDSCVMIDDMDVLESVVGGCGGAYPRPGWLSAPTAALCRDAEQTGRKLLFGGGAPSAAQSRAFRFRIEEFEVPDYELLIRAYLPSSQAERLKIEKIHRFAPGLTAHQIRNACLWLADDDALDTERFIE